MFEDSYIEDSLKSQGLKWIKSSVVLSFSEAETTWGSERWHTSPPKPVTKVSNESLPGVFHVFLKLFVGIE